MLQNNLFVIIKFGKAKHIQKLCEYGDIYMQRAENYAQIEEDNARADKNENLTHLFQVNEVKSFKINGQEIPIVKNIKIKISERKNPFVFCSYALNEKCFNNRKNNIDNRCLDFGDTALVITDFNQFFKRIKDILSINEDLYCNVVEYIDKASYNGKMGIFRKFKSYSYQNEHRIVLDTVNYNEKDELELSLGSLKDIAKIFPSKVLLDTLKI